MFLRTRCSKLNMRELIIQGCPYWVYGGTPPIIRKSTQPPLPAKIPPPQQTTTTTIPIHSHERLISPHIKSRRLAQGLIFFKVDFQWLILCGASIQTFEFLNLKIEKELVRQVQSYYSYKLHLLHEMRDAIFSFLSKDKK